MSFNPHDYPPTWPAMRAMALRRCRDFCEGTDRYPECDAKNYEPHPVTKSRVVLTLAHLPGTSKMSTDMNDVRMLCQRCHLDLDRRHHLAKAAETRARKRGQLALFGGTS